ncbi:MAG: hypothetical protein GWO04_46590, partial [Actinobacteria bacterium]|nr:hypothetical protein [Actinomycetota bacterium]NIV59198.1 hypothetical protein [Actinomycetota bacterium]NIV90815.1 hypothetical protein [Actinomycetota bacterium]
AELSALRLALDEEIGDPLTSAEANALVATLEIWADSDDSGTLDPLTDSLLREVMPLALVGGELEVDFPAPDPALEVDAGET